MKREKTETSEGPPLRRHPQLTPAFWGLALLCLVLILLCLLLVVKQLPGMRAGDNHSSTDSGSHALGKVLPRAAEGNETESLTQRFLAAKGLVWSQKWDCGHWRPADEPANARGYVESFTPAGKKLGMSVCESCRSVRIVDCDRLLQRLLPRDATADTCAHQWKLAVTRASFDPLAPGDLLFAVYEEKMFALRLGPINARIAYDVAAVPPSSLPDVNVATLQASGRPR